MNKAREVIVELRTGAAAYCLLGTFPMIYNAMSEKTRLTLLDPPPKKTTVERASTLKHEPFEEYRDSVYQHRDNEHPTRLYFPAGGFKKAMMNAALRTEGGNKTETGQTLWVEGINVDIFGVPQIYLERVRSSGISKTPDIRSRAILPQWCAQITVTYIQPQFSSDLVTTLLANAGIVAGIGDWRPEKGGQHGRFEIVSVDDVRYQNIIKHGGRVAQDKALADPTCYNIETEKLLALYAKSVEKKGDRIRKAA